jgi:DNA-binding transcriptional MerR regulator
MVHRWILRRIEQAGDLMVYDKHKTFYSVGETSKICNISKKALRFYDEIAVISPDKIGENDYRYYSWDTMLIIPVIKYYKQMGFKLNEMKAFIKGGDCPAIERAFRNKLSELTIEESRIREQYTSVRDWHELIHEAMMVIETRADTVGVKYYDAMSFCALTQPFNPDYKDAIINIEFTNFIESINNEITGPVIRYFDAFRDKLTGTIERQQMLQKTIRVCDDCNLAAFGGGIMLSCYHIGPHENISVTYEKMLKWADCHHYRCGMGAYERYVIDYWTTSDSAQYVTEVIMEISR